MPPIRSLLPARARRVAVAGVTLLLALTLAPSAVAHHAGAEPGPIHAGNTYGWWKGGHITRWEFETGRLADVWKVEGRGVVRHQYGMLTLNTARRGSVSATLAGRGRAYGRWEIRLRSARFERSHTNYRVVTELVPAGDREQHCGARDIALENYQIGRRYSTFYINTLPDNSFVARKSMNLVDNRWHTFAVEVTRKRISWFVDAHVVRSERRGAALSGVPLTVRFTMRGVKGQRMNKSRMQMDWLRYWTLEAPNTRSVKAPGTELVTNRSAC